MSSRCPCGSGLLYTGCCEPLHNGTPAASPEALMRSRYSAFALENAGYLLFSWDEETRPETLEFTPDTQWLGLQIHAAEASETHGWVHFTARFRECGEWLQLEERSNFRRAADGGWRYRDGDARFTHVRPGRNDECPCGSGRKFKKCCGV